MSSILEPRLPLGSGRGWPAFTTLRVMPVESADAGDLPERRDFVELVRRAQDGDQGAKLELVDVLKRLVWHMLGDFRLSNEDRQDVFATTFCRLFEQIEANRIRDPQRLPGWMATTARNEARNLLRLRGRFVVADDLGDQEDDRPAADEGVLNRELGVALHLAFQGLPRNCQRLLRLASAIPPLSYDEIGELLTMPHGSIGPTRRRCLDRLRNMPTLRPFLD